MPTLSVEVTGPELAHFKQYMQKILGIPPSNANAEGWLYDQLREVARRGEKSDALEQTPAQVQAAMDAVGWDA